MKLLKAVVLTIVLFTIGFLLKLVICVGLLFGVFMLMGRLSGILIFIPYDLSQAEIVRMSDSDKLTPEGITQKTIDKIRGSPAINNLRNTITDPIEMEIFENGILAAARATQARLSDPFSKDVNIKARELQFIVTNCFDELWKMEGLIAITVAMEAPEDTFEKRSLSVAANHDLPMVKNENRHPSKEECLQRLEGK